MNQLTFQVNIPGYSINNPLPTSTNFTGSGSLANLISVFLNLALTLAGILLLIWLIISAFQWITSEGDKEKLTQARARIIYTIIGFVIIVLAYTLKAYIYDVLQPQYVPVQSVIAPPNFNTP